ncbi:MAG: hypothetical protein ACLQMT_04600 [Candidatus Acidiferrales bacterium]
MPRMNRLRAAVLLVATGLALLLGPFSLAKQAPAQPSAVAKPSLTVDEIVSHLEEKNHERAEALRGFQGTRVYRIEYHGFFGNRDAEMTVNVCYKSPDSKEFTIISQSGSKFLIDHVLKGLLDGEKEAATADNQEQTALNSQNYDFTLAGVETTQDGAQYVLTVSPKTRHKYLYQGKIWVDGKDFAVTRIEAEPSKSPSFWVKKSEISHKYEKVDDFWLPAQNRTESWIRLGGHALLSIDYQDYKITGHAPLEGTTDAAGMQVSDAVAGQN